MKRYDENAFEMLLSLGRETKTLTTTQISAFMEDCNFNFDQLLNDLESEGIQIVDDEVDNVDDEIDNVDDVDDVDDDENVNESEIKETTDYKDSFATYLKDIGKLSVLSAEEERELARLTKEGSPLEAKLATNKLVEYNLKLVVSIAKRYARTSSMPIRDIVSDGNLGLFKAVEKYDYKRGFKFSTYATWWIKQAIKRGEADTSRLVRIPVHMHEKNLKVNQAEQHLLMVLEREPSIEEIAEYLEISTDDVKKIKNNTANIVSLQTPIGEDDDTLLIDLIEDKNNDLNDESIINKERRQMLELALKQLDERTAYILKLRFGIIDGRVYTLEEVGKKINLTRERVRQIEVNGIRKLYRWIKRNK